MTDDLDGKVAIVTGGARGIGAATARAFVRAGARVVIGDVNERGLDAMAGELGSAVRTCRADITTEAGVAGLVEEAVDTFGRLDILHNNAAFVVNEDVDVVSTTDAAWRTTFDFTVMAVVWGLRHGIPAMVASGGGSIVNMSSGASVIASAVKAAYGSCKAAIETLTMYTAAQCGTDGIRCNAVQPGFVLTEGIREVFSEEHQREVAAGAALGRICTPEDVADVVLWLASSASGYVNGQVIPVNGGGQKPTTAW